MSSMPVSTTPAIHRRSRLLGAGFIAGIALAVTGCSLESVEVGQTGDAPTFEEFKAGIYQEPWQDGVFIVNGDTPVVDDKALREFYDALHGEGALIVHQAGGADAKWSNTQKLNLSYCVGNGFGARKNEVVQAMAAATEEWEAAANVNFVYLAGEDANCTPANANVVFDVNQVEGQPYLARAFFPDSPRSRRNVLIDTSSFGNLGAITLVGILRHELGHTLGFRHEHTRPESGTCFEDNNWRALTTYDSASVMHYPQCNGTANNLAITQLDKQGAAALYGAPTGGGDPTPPPPPAGGTAQSGSAEGQLARNEQLPFEPIAVTPSSSFRVTMTGTGDADLYVRFGATPTFSQFDCRPYLIGSAEVCDLDVPADATQAFIMVHGFTESTFQLTAEWVGPAAQ